MFTVKFKVIKILAKQCKANLKSCEFLSGIVIGVCIYFYFNLAISYEVLNITKTTSPQQSVLNKFDLLKNSHAQQSGFIDVRKHGDNIAANRLDNKTIAMRLKGEIKILCWVMAITDAELNEAIYVKNAWGHRCNKFVIISSHSLESINAVKVLDKTNNIRTWNATKRALKHLFEHDLNYDWFFFADLNTFTILENLRQFLSGYLPAMPIYFGHKFKNFIGNGNGFMNTRPGYVLSREALQRFGFEAYDKCRMLDYGYGCVELGHCMDNVGVIAADSRDENKRDRFLRSKIGTVMLHQNSNDSWMDRLEFYEINNATDVVSNTLIALSNIPAPLLMTFQYIIYNLRAFGIVKPQHPPPIRLSWQEIVKRSKHLRP